MLQKMKADEAAKIRAKVATVVPTAYSFAPIEKSALRSRFAEIDDASRFDSPY